MPLADPHEIETTVEYCIVRIYRHRQSNAGNPASMVGVVENAEGRRKPFRDKEELWETLAALLRRHRQDRD